MREGLEKEEQIAQVFISEKSKKGFSGVSLEECGFFISKSMVFLEHLQTESFSYPPRVTQATNYVIRCFLPRTNGVSLWHVAQIRRSSCSTSI